MECYSYYRVEFSKFDNDVLNNDLVEQIFDSVEEASAAYNIYWWRSQEGYCTNFFAKWHDPHDYMVELSIKMPGVLFMLYKEYENVTDSWRAYYLNGKFQYCPAQITYDDFDPDKLM